MAARKVPDSVEAEPPFANAVRMKAGETYPDGIIIGDREQTTPQEIGAREGIVWSGTGKWGTLACHNHTHKQVDKPCWFVRQTQPSFRPKNLRQGDRLEPGQLVMGKEARWNTTAAVVLVDEFDNCTFVKLRPGDKLVIETACTVHTLGYRQFGEQTGYVQWRPRR